MEENPFWHGTFDRQSKGFNEIDRKREREKLKKTLSDLNIHSTTKIKN